MAFNALQQKQMEIALNSHMGFEYGGIRAHDAKCEECSRRVYHIYVHENLTYRGCPSHPHAAVRRNKTYRDSYAIVAKCIPAVGEVFNAQVVHTKRYPKPELPQEAVSVTELVKLLEGKRGYGITYAYTHVTQGITQLSLRLTTSADELARYAENVKNDSDGGEEIAEGYLQLAEVLRKTASTLRV